MFIRLSKLSLVNIPCKLLYHINICRGHSRGCVVYYWNPQPLDFHVSEFEGRLSAVFNFLADIFSPECPYLRYSKLFLNRFFKRHFLGLWF